MIRFQTMSGSCYEYDDERRRIRRLIGLKDPTPRQGEDGQWKNVKSVQIILGEPAIIFWPPNEVSPNGDTEPATLTSPVTEIRPYHDKENPCRD